MRIVKVGCNKKATQWKATVRIRFWVRRNLGEVPFYELYRGAREKYNCRLKVKSRD